MTIAVFSNDELHVLKKIWEELSERSNYLGINKQTFLKYIPMNGVLGERLFLQFDKENTGYISQENFINGLSILCLGTLTEQCKFLFNIFDVNQEGKIFKQNLSIILNYVPSDIFCNCKMRSKSNSVESNISDQHEDFMIYTNYCYCESILKYHKEYLNYDEFYDWFKHTPALIGYIKSIIPCMSEDDFSDTDDKFTLWKIGDKTKFILKRHCLLKGNCLYYYYNKQDMKPKGIIFLAGSIIEQYDDIDMIAKGYYGFAILQQSDNDAFEVHHYHEKRIFYCNSLDERYNLIHKLQHLAHIIPFDEDYKIGKKIGTGAHSEVFECEHNITKEMCAVKIIHKKIFQKVNRLYLNNEIAILKLVNHPNVIHLKETYEDKENIYIVLELIKDGDFFDFINNKSCLKDDELRPIMKQLLEATAYLHEFGIVHCDIKPENMLYNKTTGNIIKLTDFGLSRMILSNQKLNMSCGTLQYVAPEILTSKCSGMESDIWSIGVIMYLLVNGKLPYDANTPDEILSKIMMKKLYFRNCVSENTKELILALLEPNQKKRITAKCALSHPYFSH